MPTSGASPLSWGTVACPSPGAQRSRKKGRKWLWLLWAPSSWAVGLLAVTLWRRRADVSVADTLQRPETWSCWHRAADLRPGPPTPTWWPGPGGAPASPAPLTVGQSAGWGHFQAGTIFLG